MAAQYQSISSSVWNSTPTNSKTITKPSGVVDGDLLVAIITWDSGSAETLTTLSGWTLIRNDNLTSLQNNMSSFYKIAASEGSSYVWSFSGNVNSIGLIARINQFDVNNPIDTSNGSGTSTTDTHSLFFTDSVTPSQVNNLILFPIQANEPSQTTARDITSQSITNDNPIWNEILDSNGSPTDAYVLSLCYTNRPQKTPTGNSSATCNGGVGVTRFISQKIVVNSIPGQNINIATTAESTVVGSTLNATAPAGVQVGDLLIAQSGVNNASSSVTAPSGWTTANFQQSPGGGSSGSNVYIQYKIADSSDASAGTFQFISSTSNALRTIILRVTGNDTSNPFDSTNKALNNSVSGGGTKTFTNTVTPSRVGSLLIASFVADNTNLSISNVAVTNNNPTWTKQYNDTITQMYSAVYSVASATGDMTTNEWVFGTNGTAIISVFNPPVTTNGNMFLTM